MLYHDCFLLFILLELRWFKSQYVNDHLLKATKSIFGEGNAHSSTLAWKIPWTEEPGRLQSMGSLRVGHDWATYFDFSLSCIAEGSGNPLQCSFLENPRDRGAWWVAVYGVTQSRTQLKWLTVQLQCTMWLGVGALNPPLLHSILKILHYSHFQSKSALLLRPKVNHPT